MSVRFPAGWVISGGRLGLNKNSKRGKKEGERKLKEERRWTAVKEQIILRDSKK